MEKKRERRRKKLRYFRAGMLTNVHTKNGRVGKELSNFGVESCTRLSSGKCFHGI